VVVVGAILAVTLFPVMGEETRPLRWCAGCGERGVAHVLLNIILFMPLGALLTLAGVPRSWNWLSGAVMSTLIEGAQLFIPGRDSSVDDVLTNTTGTILGSLVAVAVLAWLRGLVRPPAAAMLAPAGAVLLAVAASGLLFQPSFPRDIDYYGQWTPDLGHFELYRGRVLRAELSSAALPSLRLADTPRVRGWLLSGAPLHVQAVAGPPVTRLAPVFSVYDGAQREILLLGLDRSDLVLRLRTQGYAWGFDQPDLRFHGAARTLTPGDTVDLAMWRERGRVCLQVNARRACGLGFTPGRGWGILIYPESFPEWLRRLVDMSWIGGLLFLVGFLSRGGRAGLLVRGGVSLLGLAVLPPLVGLLEPPPLEWVAAVVGLMGGAVAWAALARRARISAAGLPTT
jgi:hypothetical protein